MEGHQEADAHRAPRTRALIGVVSLIALLALGAPPAATAAGHGEGEAPESFGHQLLDSLTGGKPTANIRARIELANIDAPGIERSEAYTLRTRLGYGTKPLHGVSLYMDFENIATPDKGTYFFPTDLPNDDLQTVIADPPGTEVNQGFMLIDRPDWFGSKLKGGRQRLILDDARFIGNVGWRQNEQTYDGIWFTSSGGIEDFSLGYGWLGNVNRIFGGGGNNPALDDFESDSHLIHVAYKGLPYIDITAFGYLLELEAKALPEPAEDGASNATYGVRVSGQVDVTDDVAIDFLGSYAAQRDYGESEADYDADYALGQLGVKAKGIGRVAVGYELLGSDDGAAVFQTPLATAHKFNGFADVYLNNGGPAGLQDLYIQIAPALPFAMKAMFVFHRFWDAEDDIHRGDEYDFVLSRAFGRHWNVLAKAAFFDDESDEFAEVDIWRFTLDTTFKF